LASIKKNNDFKESFSDENPNGMEWLSKRCSNCGIEDGLIKSSCAHIYCEECIIKSLKSDGIC